MGQLISGILMIFAAAQLLNNPIFATTLALVGMFNLYHGIARDDEPPRSI